MAPETAKVVPLTCHGHSRPVTHLSFSAVTDDDQFYLISACKDNNPMLRDGVTGDWIGTFIGHKGAVWQARLSADAKLAATGSADFSAKVWDTHTGEALHTLQHNHIVRAVAFPSQPSPQILATGGAEKKLRIFDLSRSSTPQAHSNGGTNGNANGTSSSSDATNTQAQSYEIGPGVHTGTIKSIIWSPTDSNVLITASEDQKVRWWDLRSRSVIGEYAVEGAIGSCELSSTSFSSSSTSSASSPAFASPFNGSSSTDGTVASSEQNMLSVAASSKVYFFALAPTAPASPLPLKTHTLPPSTPASSVALNIAARRFVTGGGGDTWVRVFDFDSGEELEVGKGHHGPVWSVAFSPNGRLYATGSEDGTIKLWKFGEGGYGLWR